MVPRSGRGWSMAAGTRAATPTSSLQMPIMKRPMRSEFSEIRLLPDMGGVEVMRARLTRHVFARHMHEGFALGVVEAGMGIFNSRGRTSVAPPGRITVLHPEEAHDGRGGSEDGLTYRMIYLSPEGLHRL